METSNTVGYDLRLKNVARSSHKTHSITDLLQNRFSIQLHQATHTTGHVSCEFNDQERTSHKMQGPNFEMSNTKLCAEIVLQSATKARVREYSEQCFDKTKRKHQ
eukprot:1330451-Amphidinium_carterae.2